MAHRAGVALSRIAENAPFIITRVDGAPDETHFYPPVEYKLDGDSVEEIMSTVTRLVGFDTTLPDNDFAITYPIAFPEEQRAGFKGGRPSHGHLTAFVHGYDFTTMKSEKDDGSFDVLFIDLTPGQVAARLVDGELLGGSWCFALSVDRETILGDAGEISPQDVVDKLITPTITTSLLVNLIGIFRPEGPSTEISAILEAQFPNTTVKWVSLADLSHGAAVVMHSMSTRSSIENVCMLDVITLPLGIALANGTTVAVLAKNLLLPKSRTVVLTNSRDNQTTATLQFLKGTLPCGEVTIEGLTEKPKGAARIQVAIEVDYRGETVVTVQEVGGAARKVGNIQNMLQHTGEDIDAYSAEATIKQVSPTNEGDTIGELPE